MGGGAVSFESKTTDPSYPWPRFWVPRDGIIDLSDAAARALGMKKNGVVHVRLEAFHGDQAPG